MMRRLGQFEEAPSLEELVEASVKEPPFPWERFPIPGLDAPYFLNVYVIGNILGLKDAGDPLNLTDNDCRWAPASAPWAE